MARMSYSIQGHCAVIILLIKPAAFQFPSVLMNLLMNQANWGMKHNLIISV